jgi:hypothetical protein
MTTSAERSNSYPHRRGDTAAALPPFLLPRLLSTRLGSLPSGYALSTGSYSLIFFIVQSAVGATTVPPGDKSGKFAPKFCLVLKFNCQLRATGGHNFFLGLWLFLNMTSGIKKKI